MNEGKGDVCLFELLPLSDSLGRALSLSLRLLRKYVRTHLSSLADKFRAPGLRAGPRGAGFRAPQRGAVMEVSQAHGLPVPPLSITSTVYPTGKARQLSA